MDPYDFAQMIMLRITEEAHLDDGETLAIVSNEDLVPMVVRSVAVALESLNQKIDNLRDDFESA